MTPDNAQRRVTIDRVRSGKYTVTNARGGTISVGGGDDADFTPVELLLTAIAACTSIDVDIVTSRRAEPDSFQVQVEGTKVRDDKGNHLKDIAVTFSVAFPEGEAGDAARKVLPDIVKKSHDVLCTVSRTVELGTPVTTVID